MQEKIKLWACYTVIAFGGGALFFLLFRYFAGILLPFLLGWGIALLVRGPAEFLHQKIRVSRGVARLLLVFLLTAVLGAFLFFGVRGIVKELSLFLEGFGQDPSLTAARIRAWISELPLVGAFLASGDFLERSLSALLSSLLGLLATLAEVLPSFFFTLGVAAIAAVYFCLDLDRIHAALVRRMPERLHKTVFFAKDSAVRAALSVLRAQGILMLIAFVGMLVGFILLDVKYPLLLSGLFALLDFLPVLGVGLFLLPWSIVSLLAGERVLGVGLLILFALIGIVRQFAEPRLLGRGYGVHPLLTLFSLYAGGKLFGFLGLLLFPAMTLLLYEIFFGSDNEKRNS